MSLQEKAFLAACVICAAVCAPAAAAAGEILYVDGAEVTSRHDPFLPAAGARSHPGRPPHRASPARAAAARTGAPPARAAQSKKKKRPTRGQRAVARGLSGARKARTISRAEHRRYGRLYARARSTRAKLRGTRGRELGNVIATLEAIALRRQLTPTRVRPLFLILRRNLSYWPRRPLPPNRAVVMFKGSELAFEYYRGNGLQLQPLVNFKRANLMRGACVRDTGVECRRDRLRRLLEEMTELSVDRGGFRAWEYYFDFGGGRPPWISGMAQATGIQGFARAWQLLGDRSYLATAQEGFGAFESAPPTGVATTGPFGGTHYLQYSFAPRLYITNAFVQALIGLYDYSTITGETVARRLYDRAEPELRQEVPASDTGDWSRYSYRGRESTPGYHELLRELLKSLCDRVRTPVYCVTATNFRRYATEPAELALLGPATVLQDQPTRVRFSVSKLSAVQLTITRDGRTAIDRLATFRRGSGSFAWTPKAAGSYSVRVASKELRTGRGLRTLVHGRIESLPDPAVIGL